MAINFAAANTAGLNNPSAEIITLVKDGSGNFINPPSYDKMRAYLRSGEVPMLFVTTEGGETGSLYQLVEYSETENKIRFGNDINTIEFGAGREVPVVSDVVPKPLTYDYMPEGYPTKATGTVTVMEAQEVPFSLVSSGTAYRGKPGKAFEIVAGQTYTVNWDGTVYECVGLAFAENIYLCGNLSIQGGGADTGEPFLYTYDGGDHSGQFRTLDTSATHTISVTTAGEVVTPMAEEFLPAAALITYDSSSNTYSTDLAYDELYERLLGGKQVILHKTVDNQYLYLTKWQLQGPLGTIKFAFAGGDYSVELSPDGTIHPIK